MCELEDFLPAALLSCLSQISCASHKDCIFIETSEVFFSDIVAEKDLVSEQLQNVFPT